MSDLLPLATYNLNIEPYTPTPAIDVTRPVTVRITMAALNPEAYDDEKKPSTLRIVKRNPDFDDEDDILNGDYDEDEFDEEEEQEEEEEEEEEEEKPKKKKAKKQEKDEEEKEDDDEEEDDDDEDDEFEEYVLLTLSPKGQYQQSVDITIAPEEDVQFVVTGSYAISLSGNYIKHPFDAVNMDEDEEDDEEGQYYDSDEYDLTPDEDEIIDDELDDLEEEASDVEARVEELVEEKEQEQEQEKKPSNKRKQEEKQEQEAANKKAKKEKKAKPAAEKEKKKVEFKKELEEGPTKKTQDKPKTKTRVLEGGVTIEDRTVGKGAQAKKSSKVGMRYIGKLKNGKVFDKNTSGKPFVFKLGHGEVIKGWDIGVAGMAVGGERRIIIPAPYAYGKQALPGIPANSELTFDVKLVSLK
ncbi:hypothetical protein HG536_0C06040 [Torulaspora globosa]|uniref:FK506-binding protein n=1 Tax=Torulaspora globosa TaxID=48254 RepID=A0A7G3ZFZ9_9SACH|nr:uncharacterized protein HG536_0C06040 [Torulaspora globosa]QLL32435.1 hypothetical protein HG536_0C06040 [Torulaspora globosa]